MLDLKPCKDLEEFDDYRDDDGLYSLDKELSVRWARKTQDEKEIIFRYLKLLKRFNKNPDLINKTHKKWMLENCDCETELVPIDLMGEYWL